MEQGKWKKDKTPYLIFSCTKCQQYFYVRTLQKTKKCLRCGRRYQVKEILNLGEIVYGISIAVKRVKELQNIMGTPYFSSENEFVAYVKNLQNLNENNTSLLKKTDCEGKFHELLVNLSLKYKEFPLYMIEILANDYNIPLAELNLLLRKFINKGFLVPDKKKATYFRYSNK